MGCSTTKDSRCTQIDHELKEAKKEYRKQIKILLLGPGESGKSTIFKQMKIIQDDGGFTEEELIRFKTFIFTNCISQMRLILQALLEKNISLGDTNNVPFAEALIKHSGVDWSSDLGNAVKRLWADQAVQQVFKSQASQLNDTAKYFFENIDRINSPDYIPTEDDVLRVRVKSSGIEEAVFSFDKIMYRVVDVGGQRSERRKWMHCFDAVTAVLFCASLSEYDLPLREDPRVNRLEEALRVFSEVTNQEIFEDKAIIFFLNKRDLLIEKMHYIPLQNYREDFIPPNSDINTEAGEKEHFSAAIEYFRTLFLSQINKDKRKMDTVFVHNTCALDTENVEHVITDVRKQLLNIIIDEIGY